MKTRHLFLLVALVATALVVTLRAPFESKKDGTQPTASPTQTSTPEDTAAHHRAPETDSSTQTAQAEPTEAPKAHTSPASTDPTTPDQAPQQTDAPAWFSKVEDRDALRPDPIILEKDGLEGIEEADLSEMEIRGRYMLAVQDIYEKPLDKHEQRERSHLTELIEELAVRQAHARAQVEGIAIEGTRPDGESFLLIGFEGGEPVFSVTLNESAAISTGAAYVRQETDFDTVFGPDIDGSGFFFNINDYGIPRQHLEFQFPDSSGSRLINREVPNNDDHPDHVAGTVGAHGYRTDAKGMSPAVWMYGLNQQSDSDVTLLGMRYAFEPRRSIGGTTSLGSNSSVKGSYTSESRNFDNVLREHTYYLHFYAAANNGDWDSISNGRAIAKNVVTVASGKGVSRDAQGNYLSGGSLSGFSSRGPADDGRIKPDITGNGEGVTSTKATDSYASKQGTSMAAPTVSGSSILLQDYFSKRFPGHLMKSMSVKNLILHTADDLGNTGPDYKYGWGFMNTRKAAEVIQAYADNPGNRRITEAVLENGQTHTYTFTWDGSSSLVANLAWLDYGGSSNFSDNDRASDLVYDLDLRVVSPSGATTYLPWAMPFVLNGFDTNDYDTDAVKADNTTDNVEQVRIGSPAETGVYTVEVSHKGTIDAGEPVTYSLIVSGVDNSTSALAPLISSFTPNSGHHHHSLITITGSRFLLGANVSLEAPGLDTVEGYAEVVTPTEIQVYMPLDRVAEGNYKLVVKNPDGKKATASSDFVVSAYEDLLYEDFDAAGFDFAAAGWATGAITGSNDWTLSTEAVSGNSAHVPTRTEEVNSYLESPPIVIPNTSAPIKLSFEHQWDFEIELASSSFSSHDAEDGAILMVSVNGGEFKHVDQSFWDNGEAQGASIISGDYWDNLDTTNPLRYPSATTYAWTDESGGWQRTTVLLDAATYKNKTLRFRWCLGTQNTGSDTVEGWWIDNVSVSVESSNVLPQIDASPATTATEGQAYNETLNFSDADGDALTLTATTLPSWLTFTDNGNRTATLSGTPSSGDVGTESLVIEANDGTGTRTCTFSLIVAPAGGNGIPTFSTTALDAAIIDQAYTFTLLASDADGHALSFNVSGLPAWLTFTDNGDGTGTFSGTPNSYAVGTVTLETNVTDGIGATSRAYSLDIQPPAQISLSATAINVSEGAGSVTLTVSRTQNSSGAVSIDYTTGDNTATAGADYTSTSGTLNWANTDGTLKTIEIPILDDSIYNEAENFTLTLSNPTGAAILGTNTSATITIDEDDLNEAPTITFNTPSTNVVSIPTGVSLVVDTTVIDDGILNPFTLTWAQVSGSGTATFSSTNTEDTTLSFSASGDYMLRLTADDGISQSTRDLIVSVAGTAPIYVTQDGLFAHLTFDDGVGATASDSVTSDGESNDGTLINGAAWSTTGVSGGALANDPSNDMVTIENSTQINDGTFAQKTIALWFKTSDITTRQTLYEQGGNSRGIHLYLDAGKVYAGGWNNNENGWDSTYLSASVSTDTWHHVAFVLDATEGSTTLNTGALRLYVDGALAGTGDAAPINIHTGGIGIGGVNNSANFHDAEVTSGYHFSGRIDELVLYNRALTGGEIQALNGGGNIGPSVSAGGSYSGVVGATAALDGTVTDDGLPVNPGTLTTTWSLTSGPGTVTFAAPSAIDTTVVASVTGTYKLRLTATDGEFTTFAETDYTATASGSGGVSVQTTGMGTMVEEGGIIDSYYLTLTAQPTNDVTISLNSGTQLAVDKSSVTFTTGNWNTPQTITVSAVDDSAVEGFHTGSVTHTSSSDDSDFDGMTINDLIASIFDNDSYGTLALTTSSLSANEADGTTSLTVRRTGGSAGEVSIDYASADGTATAGSDYTAVSGTLTWADGDSADKTIQITLTDDALVDANETFSIDLSNVTGGASLGTSSATITLIDDEFDPTAISGLVGWYDAQTLNGTDGTAISNWADLTDGGNNTVANDLSQVSSGVQAEGQTAVAPTLQTVALNGHNYRAVRFASGGTGEYELLEANGLVSNGDSTRTLIVVYQGGVDHGGCRIAGFGSKLVDGLDDTTHWNIATDGNGSLRFDGAYNTDHSAGLTRTDMLIRTAAMESTSSFDEFIDILDNNFTDTQVLSNATPNNPLGAILGDFYLGDLQTSSPGGELGAADFDILEVIVYDNVLNTTQRQAMQNWLKQKYTTAPAGGSTPTAPSNLSATTASSTQINLSWTDNANNETGFKVQRSTTSSSGFSTITTTSADATDYSDTGLNTGTTYYYQLIATNATGDSSPTPEASATTWTPLEQWQSDNSVSDLAADEDGDRIANLLEYAFNGDPNTADNTILPTVGLSGDNLTITFNRVRSDLSYVVQGSSEMSIWTDIATNPGTVGAFHTETDTETLNTAVNRFLRVKIITTP